MTTGRAERATCHAAVSTGGVTQHLKRNISPEKPETSRSLSIRCYAAVGRQLGGVRGLFSSSKSPRLKASPSDDHECYHSPTSPQQCAPRLCTTPHCPCLAHYSLFDYSRAVGTSCSNCRSASEFPPDLLLCLPFDRQVEVPSANTPCNTGHLGPALQRRRRTPSNIISTVSRIPYVYVECVTNDSLTELCHSIALRPHKPVCVRQ